MAPLALPAAAPPPLVSATSSDFLFGYTVLRDTLSLLWGQRPSECVCHCEFSAEGASPAHGTECAPLERLLAKRLDSPVVCPSVQLPPAPAGVSISLSFSFCLVCFLVGVACGRLTRQSGGSRAPRVVEPPSPGAEVQALAPLRRKGGRGVVEQQ